MNGLNPADDDLEAARGLAPGCVAAALALGLALQLGNGFLLPSSLALLTVTIVLLCGAIVLPRPRAWHLHDRRLVLVLAIGGLLTHEYFLLTVSPGVYVKAGPGDLRAFHAGVLALAAFGASAVVLSPSRTSHRLTVALVAVYAALGVWVIQHAPRPPIDVFVFQRDGVNALLQGQNPFAMTFPDVYRSGSGFYGPGLSVDGRLQFGFPYFPLSLLAAVPGQLLGHDPRYSQLGATVMAALLMAMARPGGLGTAAAALYLTTPRTFFVLEQAWTEPFVVLGATAVVFAACRVRALTPWLFGAFVAIKQYLVFALPFALLLVSRRDGVSGVAGLLARGAAVGAALTLPFVLWDPSAFVTSVVTLQVHQPFRADALSYLAWWVGLGHPPPSTLIPFLIAIAASALALWRLPRTAAGFGAALALTFVTFFAFNKQAFANYYYFVLGLLFATVAAWRPPVAAELQSPDAPVVATMP